MVTAVLGALIFSESLPPLWFLGAALLVVGNVIIGRRDEGDKEDGAERDNGANNGEGDDLLGGSSDAVDLEDLEETERRRKMAEARREQEDILNLDENDGEREARDDLQLL